MLRPSTPSAVSTIGIDIGKNIFHLIGLDQRGQNVSQGNCQTGIMKIRIRKTKVGSTGHAG